MQREDGQRSATPPHPKLKLMGTGNSVNELSAVEHLMTTILICIMLPRVAISVLIRECSHSKRVPLELVIVNTTVLGFWEVL